MNRVPLWMKCVSGLLLFGATLAILFPTCACSRARENAKRSSCQSNLKQIALACAQYLQDYDERYPLTSTSNGEGWADLLYPYLKNQKVFQCPSAADKDTELSTDYFYNSRAAHLIITKSAPFERTIVFGDGQDNGATNTFFSQIPMNWKSDEKSPVWRHLAGANYAFGDGHVKWLKPQNITPLKPGETEQNIYSFEFQKVAPINQSHPQAKSTPQEDEASCKALVRC